MDQDLLVSRETCRAAPLFPIALHFWKKVS